MDATFEKIEKIIPHDNADTLEIAIVSNFPCVVKKEEFKEGDLVFYIRDDAKLLGYDELQERIALEKQAEKTGGMIPSEQFSCKFPWQDSLLKYLGSGGRVKTIRLRGKISMGILLRPDVVCGKNSPYCCYSFINEENYRGINDLIKDKDKGVDFLRNNFGIVHWEAPITNFGEMNVAYKGIPQGLWKTDEENFENIPEEDLHLGAKCLVTRKYDGSSTTTTCFPDGHYETSCRTMTFKDEQDPQKFNTYQKLTQDIARAGIWWAKKHNKIIAFRSESCCGAFNKSSFNKCCQLNDSFVFACNFPEEENFFDKAGVYGTDGHFLKIVEECNSNGFNLKTVDVLEKDVVITKELLKKYSDAPYTDGEGVVINVKCEDKNQPVTSLVWHYKSKSRDYLSKMK